MAHRFLNPPELAKPPGFSHGAIGTGQMLYISGQIGNGADAKLVGDELVEQFDQALGNVLHVVHAAGGAVEDIIKINLLVVDPREYTAKGKAIGAAYRKHMGRHFPAMTLAGVSGLFDERAKVEIEAIAMLPKIPSPWREREF